MAEKVYVVFDETIKGDMGDLRLVVEIPRTQSNAEKYWLALRDARDIPIDLDAINPLNPMYQYVYTNFPNFKGYPERAKDQVRKFFEEQSRQAYRDAVILAITVDNKFDFEPTPWTDEELGNDEDLPGIVVAPQPVRNLENGVERRLKQVFDRLKADAVLFAQFERNFDLAIVKINEELVAGNTDDAGFQPRTAHKPKGKAVIRPDFQPQA